MQIKYPALLALFLAPATHAADLAISGVIDGPLNSNPKAVEILVINDIADLSQCGVGFANNGGGTDGQEFTFPAVSVSAGTYLYVANESADFTAYMGFAPDYVSGAASINGDDAIELFCAGNVIDVFGDINVDGTGQAWEYMDGWAYRDADSNGDAAEFVLSDWSFSGVDALDNATTNDTSAMIFPARTFVSDGTGSGTGGDNGGDTGGDTGSGTFVPVTISDACYNCPELSTIKDPASFVDSQYYAAAIEADTNAFGATALRAAINDAITDGHIKLSYSEVWTALTKTDEDPTNPDNVLILYKGASIPKFDNGSGDHANLAGVWNREHVWAKSHGFPDDGSTNFAYTDINHLRPADRIVNSTRNNLDFDEGGNPVNNADGNFYDSDSFEPRDSVKGDVARMILYMDIRYEGESEAVNSLADLKAVDSLTGSGVPEIGRLCRMVQWNAEDPVDDIERSRNEWVYAFQGNRNPFIDHPEWVNKIYPTAACGELTGGGTGGTGGGTGGTGGSGGDTGGNTGTDLDPTTTGQNGSSPLILTGIVDATLTGGVPKAIEIYVAQDMDDLSVCGVGSASNGGGTDGEEFTFPAMAVTKGQFITIATETANFETFFGRSPDLTNGTAPNINGDDAVELFCNGEVVDVFGQIDVDGTGTDWEYMDGWAYRKAGTFAGGNVFSISDWTFSGKNALDNVANNASAAKPAPLLSYTPPSGEIFISEYVEGSSNNKALELYNPSINAVDLSAGNYAIYRFANGTSNGTKISLTGVIGAGDVYVVANGSSVSAILDVADQISGTITHNGDDAYTLTKDGDVIDSFGVVGVDPGSYWGSGDYKTIDNTLVRKASVTSGDTNTDDDFDPSIEWIALGKDNFSSLGNRSGIGAPEQGLVLGQCYDAATLISAVQGNGAVSPLDGQEVVVEAVVTFAAPALKGYFVQEQLADMDADAQTSEGLFVYANSTTGLPAEGAVMRVKGQVNEFYNRTQLNAAEVLDCGSDSVSSTSMSLPFSADTDAEALEGMLVTTTQSLLVTDHYNLAKYGEVTLSSQRLMNPTQLYVPGSEEAQAVSASNELDRILLDDVVSGSYPETLRYPAGGLTANNTLRLGDSVEPLAAIVDYAFNAYRLLPVEEPVFSQTNPRDAAPVIEQGNLSIASMNVLNLYNGDGLGEGFPTERGADSVQEYERQLAKAVAAILAMNADVTGLIEIENDGFGPQSAIAQLVNALNAEAGEGVFAFVNSGEQMGTDSIKSAFIYKAAVVAPKGDALVNLDPVFNRPPVLQNFVRLEDGAEVAVAINHYRSRICSSSSADADKDQGDGQGCFNATRTAQSQALVTWLANVAAQLEHVVVIGDLNSYAMEQPVQTIVDAGFVNAFADNHDYSYVYQGLSGSMDHALLKADMAEYLVDATHWHINADEPKELDYNVENKSEAQLVDWYSADPFRASDHDPLLITLDVPPPPVFGDFNGDRIVDMRDFFAYMLAVRFGYELDMAYDLNGDGKISMSDLGRFHTLCTYRGCLPTPPKGWQKNHSVREFIHPGRK